MRSSLLAASVVLWLVLTGCGNDQVVSVCISDLDCGGGACVDGTCAHPPTLPAPDFLPVGPGCQAPCGYQCCPEGQGCRNGACVPRCKSGIWCGDAGEETCCAEGAVCSPERTCTPPPPPPPDCGGDVWDEAWGDCVEKTPTRHCDRPLAPTWEPEVLWQVTPDDAFDQVIVTPLVVDVDGDGIPEVIAPFHSRDTNVDGPAVLRALSGLDGTELWQVPATADGPTGVSQPAAAVLNYYEAVTVLVMDAYFRLRAYDGATGAFKWLTRDVHGSPQMCDVGWGAPLVVDLDGDGRPEIVCGFTVFNSQGVLRWSARPASGPLGSMVVAGDLDGDGRLELTDGTRTYGATGELWWELPEGGGLAAIADLLGPKGSLGPDGLPEVVVVRAGLLELRSGLTGEHLVAPTMQPSWNGEACFPGLGPPGLGGAPAVGDLNGDGVPEVVFTSGDCLSAMALTRPSAQTAPRWQTYWSWPAVDQSSRAVGVSLFDFDGVPSQTPGGARLDAIHADETRVHLYRGEGGILEHQRAHCSGTLYEYPVVADVDGDGSADIVLGVNTIAREAVGCADEVRPGIVVLRERQSRWANARRIWSQHAYTPGLVCDGEDLVCEGLGEWGGHGRLSREPAPPGPLSATRSNSHGALRPRAGPNAKVAGWRLDRSGCPGGVELSVRVVNDGEAPLRAGTRVDVLGDGGVVREAKLERPLPAGASTVLRFALPPEGEVYVSVDGDDKTAECAEEDNLTDAIPLSCTP